MLDAHHHKSAHGKSSKLDLQLWTTDQQLATMSQVKAESESDGIEVILTIMAKLKERLEDGGTTYARDRLAPPESSAVIRVLKEVKNTPANAKLSIGVKAKLAGTVLSQLGDVPANAERVGDALSAIDALTFN